MNDPSLPYYGGTAPGDKNDGFLIRFTTYAIGLMLALGLTGTAFWVAHSPLLWARAVRSASLSWR
jgi:heme/copper-type cytochrome/quinol oxidase subunit 4